MFVLHVDMAMSINFRYIVRVCCAFSPAVAQDTCWPVLLFLVLSQIIANFLGSSVFSYFLVTNVGPVAFFGSINFPFLQSLFCRYCECLFLGGSICAASLLHRAFLFDGLMEEWIQLEERVENPASSYYHLFITLPVSLAPSFRFLCCPLLLFNRCIFSVGY